MPKYDYVCNRGHVTEQRAGVEIASIPCRCGSRASRQQVYRSQYMAAETGPEGGKKNAPPRDEQDLRQTFSEYQEAAQEIDYVYSRVSDPKVKPRNLFKEGMRRAKIRDPRIRA